MSKKLHEYLEGQEADFFRETIDQILTETEAELKSFKTKEELLTFLQENAVNPKADLELEAELFVEETNNVMKPGVEPKVVGQMIRKATVKHPEFVENVHFLFTE